MPSEPIVPPFPTQADGTVSDTPKVPESSSERVEANRDGVAVPEIAAGTPRSKLVTKNLSEAVQINGRKYGPGVDYVPEDAFEIWGRFVVEEE